MGCWGLGVGCRGLGGGCRVLGVAHLIVAAHPIPFGLLGRSLSKEGVGCSALGCWVLRVAHHGVSGVGCLV
jgi:hypothetical protein